jgi:predicted MPP superfamily phosphohydrolase
MALTLLLAFLALILALVLWAVAIEPYRLTETRHEVALPGLPPAWEGKTVALLADFQVGMVLHNLDTIRRAVKRVVDLRPAAVLIAGDFIHQPPENLEGNLERVIGLLKPLLDARLPVYGVLGNHDYGVGVSQEEGEGYAARVEEALEAAGIPILQNEAVRLELPGHSGNALYLVGIGEHEFGHDDPERALAGLPEDAARLVMMHNPKTFKEVPARAAPLAVAGHTHGGQVRLPFLGDRYWLVPRGSSETNLSGWVDRQGEGDYGHSGNRLYITRGIGFSVVPMRLFSPPELTLFTLRRDGSASRASGHAVHM